MVNHILYIKRAFGSETPNNAYVLTTDRDSWPSSLVSVANTYTIEYGGQAPVFVLLEFFSMGPARETVDRLNGVTCAAGRTNVSTGVLSETSGAAAAVAMTKGRMTMLCLTLSVSLVLGLSQPHSIFVPSLGPPRGWVCGSKSEICFAQQQV